MTPNAEKPLVTVAVPSFNHGRFLDEALESIHSQGVPVEIMLADAGSTDDTMQVIGRWRDRLAWWRSSPDAGQAAAINQAVSRGSARYVCWLNADDTFLPGGLAAMVAALDARPAAPMVYARCWTTDANGRKLMPYVTWPFSAWLLANRNFIAQPATLVRRAAWEKAGGIDESLRLALDYDLWWRLYKAGGEPAYLRQYGATTRAHLDTKTASQRKAHVLEAMAVVRRHYGRVPLKWYLAWPYSVWARSLWYKLRKKEATTR
jgi:GT2 family glycosyltransferase